MHALGPLLRRASGARDAARLIECGFLSSEPGARAQAFHADTTPPAMRACEARTIKVQLALVEVEADMGPLEVMPRTHLLPEPANGTADGGGVGAGTEAVAFLVSPGDVTIYSTNVQHRGGANTGSRSRPTFHIAVIGDGAAPTGLPYTVLAADIRALYERRADGPRPRRSTTGGLGDDAYYR